MNWDKKVVLITGASSGIGRGFAIELARRGAIVGLLARNSDALDLVASEIEATGQRAIALAADVTDRNALHLAAQTLRQEYGHIDLLIACAGIGTTTRIENLRQEEATAMIEVNVIGVVNSVTAVLPHMTQRRAGQLVAISSLAAYRGVPHSAIYCASKAAVSALFESLRIDLKGSGIDVTIIHPGFIKTPSTAARKHMPYLLELDDAVNKMIKAIEQRKKSYSFPWQLASIVRLCMLLPAPIYDWLATKNSFRE